MDKSTLFSKTDAGREALASRPPGLGPRLRSLLIMLDGKRSLSELDKILGGEGIAMPLLEQLETAGWMARVDAAGQPARHAVQESAAAGGHAPAAGPAPVAEPTSAPALPFSEARRLVVRFINDQLGPLGEPLALRAEACKSPADLQVLLPRIHEGLKSFKNPATAQRFDQELVARLPKV
jgi:hypothetical protein